MVEIRRDIPAEESYSGIPSAPFKEKKLKGPVPRPKFDVFEGQSDEKINKFMETFGGATGGAIAATAIHVPKTIIDFTIDIIPGAKYMLQKHDRDQFYNKMTDAERNAVILHEALFLGGILVAGEVIGAAARPIAKGTSKIYGKVFKPKPKIKPPQDTAKWVAFSPSKHMSKRTKGMHHEEASAFSAAARGDNTQLTSAVVNSQYVGRPLTKAFKKSIKQSKGPYVRHELATGVDMAEAARIHGLKQYTSHTYEGLYGKAFLGQSPDQIYNAHKVRFGWTDDLATASEARLFNMVEDMLKHPRAVSSIAKAGGDLAGYPSMYPFKDLMGSSDKYYGTKAIYDEIVSGMGAKNVYTADGIKTLQKIMVSKRLGDINKHGRFIPNFSLKDKEAAYKFMTEVDDIMQSVRGRGGDMNVARRQVEALRSQLDNPVVKELSDSVYQLNDKLFMDYSKHQLDEFFLNKQLTEEGTDTVAIFLKKAGEKLRDTFDGTMSRNIVQKHGVMRELTHEAQVLAKSPNTFKMSLGPDDLKPLLYGEEKGFMPYLENYATRFTKAQKQSELSLLETLSGGDPFYTKQRVKIDKEGLKFKSFDDMIARRVGSQAYDMFAKPNVQRAVNIINDLPPSLKGATEHYMARLFNVPARSDKFMADMISLTPFVKMSPEQFMNMSKATAGLTVNAILGARLKPAAYNLFQPLMMVPTELGGVKSFKHLAKGMARLRDKRVRDYLRDEVKIITEYVPELSKGRANIFGHGRKIPFTKKTLDFRLAQPHAIRDVNMWMYKMSDEWNRYTTGAAAMNHWEETVVKYGYRNTGRFAQKVGINKQKDWVATELRGLLAKGQYDMAKKSYIKTIVGETQFLYGNMDSPLVFRGVGRNIPFQSWWMNYGTMLEKWATTGTMGDKLGRIPVFMASQATAMGLMYKMWGAKTAARRTFGGPFPFSQKAQQAVVEGEGPGGIASEAVKGVLEIPNSVPAINMVHRGMRFLWAGGDMLLNDGDNEETTKQFNALVRSTSNVFIPGSLAGQQLYRAHKQEGFEGFAKKVLTIR